MITTRATPMLAAIFALALALLPTATLAGEVEQAGPAAGPEDAALMNARDATAAFADPAVALAAGYALLTDAAGLACIDQPGTGAMGVHYVNGALVQAGTIDAARPQALVYEVRPGGGVQLVALEYVALQEGWDAAHGAPPALFGQDFMLTPAGNRYGLPAFYALHAWIWKANPSGMFSPYNPQVACGAPLGVESNAQGAAKIGAAGQQMRYACPLAHAAEVAPATPRWREGRPSLA